MDMMRSASPSLLVLFSSIAAGQENAQSKYATVNGLNMYYETHGSGSPAVLLHGAFMAISGDWEEFAREISKTRMVIAVEMQGHGRTGDITCSSQYLI
jgi:pimeloyl-ACP methyl ester carboxylesterase